MSETYPAVLLLLTDTPGNLVYHLVLAFSIAGAWQAALNLWRNREFPQGRRMVIGLGILLFVRVLLFVFAGLANQGLFDPHVVLPIIERSVSGLSLVLIVWLWDFPEPQRKADAANGLLILLTLVLTALSILWWRNGSQTAFNQTWLDAGWEIYALALLGLGLLFLLLRRPNGYGYGLAFLWISSAGHLAHLIYPNPGSDVPAAVRLAQMAAYPFLLALPQRFQMPLPGIKAKETPPVYHERKRYSIEPAMFQAILSLVHRDQPSQIYRQITQTVAEAMLADLCLFVHYLEDENNLIVQAGYNLIREEALEGVNLQGQTVPLLSSAMRQMRPLQLPASSTSKDLFTLGQALNLGRTGHLLAAFAPKVENLPAMGLILLSPYSNRGWNTGDRNYLNDLTNSLAQILQRSYHWRVLKDELEKTRNNFKALQTLLVETQRENSGLRNELSNISNQAFSEHKENLTALAAAQEESQETIARLKIENQRLEELVNSLIPEGESPSASGAEYLRSELNLSLKEIARLKKRITEADRQIMSMKNAKSAPAVNASEQTEMYAAIIQELRQPLSSILGYIDMLSGDSASGMDVSQRRLIERMRASVDRMEALYEELFQIATIEQDPYQISIELIDLSRVIAESVRAVDLRLQEREVALHLDLPERLPKIHADSEALQQVIVQLLDHAGMASPAQGEVLLRARLHTTNDHQAYALIQVIDQGGGIPSKDLPRVFSRLYQANAPKIQGTGSADGGLSSAKMLVEAHSGRIWVDTELGKGSTFSVLLPLSPNDLPSGENAP